MDLHVLTDLSRICVWSLCVRAWRNQPNSRYYCEELLLIGNNVLFNIRNPIHLVLQALGRQTSPAARTAPGCGSRWPDHVTGWICAYIIFICIFIFTCSLSLSVSLSFLCLSFSFLCLLCLSLSLSFLCLSLFSLLFSPPPLSPDLGKSDDRQLLARARREEQAKYLGESEWMNGSTWWRRAKQEDLFLFFVSLAGSSDAEDMLWTRENIMGYMWLLNNSANPEPFLSCTLCMLTCSQIPLLLTHYSYRYLCGFSC